MPHIRKDPVTKRWVIMSASRGAKPSDYVNKKEETPLVINSLNCPFCKGNEDKTPESFETINDEDGFWKVRIVSNKYPAISESSLEEIPEQNILFEAMPASGVHDVVIEDPRHNFNFYNASDSDFLYIFRTVIKRLAFLAKNNPMCYSLYFKNFGSDAGASLVHSHSQIITTPFVPIQMLEEMHGAMDYYLTHKSCVYCAMIREEKKTNKRIICENEDFIAFMPFASRFPYQVWIMPKYHHDSILYSSACDREFSSIVNIVFLRMKNVLGEVSFNYVLHTLPVYLRASHSLSSHWFLEIIPKMSKLAGYELGSGVYINSMAPEDAASLMQK